jgi:glycosyltransferase involved in cell wall biosynthesis
MSKVIPYITPIILVSNDCYWLPYVLWAAKDFFSEFIIYDVGSTDGTLDVIDRFEKIKGGPILIEKMPMVPPKAQLAYRNAPIAELITDYYLILDGDEVWPESSFLKLKEEMPGFIASEKLYGVVKRIEVSEDLNSRYSDLRGHHRLYHRSCTWTGKHPGESASIPQMPINEYNFSKDIIVYHFHNSLRSPEEKNVPKRMERKSQKTYHPGKLIPFHLLNELPILQTPIENFPVNPELAGLQEVFKVSIG